MTHIVVATRDRSETLRRTLAHIEARTKAPHHVTVIDDGSLDDTVERLNMIGVDYIRRDASAGIAANVRALRKLVKSDPFVFTDDDVLCPLVRPDWLARMLAAMRSLPSLGILALNNPQDSATLRGDTRRRIGVEGDITLCRNVGATFALIRHRVVREVSVSDGLQSPFKQFCRSAFEAGFMVGYLTGTYCQHIGAASIRSGADLSSDLRKVLPIDDDTLEPPEGYRS